MKIAMIGQKGIPTKFGGVERHVEELATRLVKLGHEVTVYTRPHYTPPQQKAFKGVKLISLKSIPTKYLDAISHTLFATLHALFKDFEIIHYHAVGPSLLSFLPRILKPKTKVVATFHCLDRKHQKWGRLAQLVLKIGEWAAVNFPHRTIVVSKTLQKYVRQNYGRSAFYIPNGVTQRENSMGDSLIKQRFGLEKNKYLVTVTRLIPHKGVHYLIQAFKNLNTQMKLAIVGDSFFTDDYVNYLKKLADDDQRIIFTGFQGGKILTQLFAHAYLFVHPSQAEGLSLSVLEAASLGKCILCSDIPENKEIIYQPSGSLGFTFHSGHIKDLQKKLVELLSSSQIVQEKGLEAQKFILKNFNWDQIAQKTHHFYQEICGEKNPTWQKTEKYSVNLKGLSKPQSPKFKV